MAGVGRNLWLTATLVVLLAIAAVVLRSTPWLCALTVLLGLAGVVELRGNRWRSGALLVAALAVAVGLLHAGAGWPAPPPRGAGPVNLTRAHEWPPPQPPPGSPPPPAPLAAGRAPHPAPPE